MPEDTRLAQVPDKPGFALGAAICLWAGYTVLQTLSVTGFINADVSMVLSFLPGIVGVCVLLTAGFSRQMCFLVVEPLSWKGFGVLAAVFVFALSAILPFSIWQGWSWKAALLYAPASGVSQELFFRSVLLPVLLGAVKKHVRLGLLLHAVLFGLWHIGPLFLGAPFWAVAAVMLVPLISGIGWGWQVQQDRTVLWAMVQHSLIWVIGNQFTVVG